MGFRIAVESHVCWSTVQEDDVNPKNTCDLCSKPFKMWDIVFWKVDGASRWTRWCEKCDRTPLKKEEE